MKGVMNVSLYIVVAIVCIILIMLLIREIRKHQIISDSKRNLKSGGITALHKLTIGGIDQYILVDGQKKENPFMLFLHGGPGQPFPFGVSSRNQFPAITEKFTAVYYDQRGAGKSFQKDIDVTTMNIEQFVTAASEIIDFIIKEYHQDKVYIVGMSWGSIIGLKLANLYPAKLYGYIGIDQIVNMIESQALGTNWLKVMAKDNQKILSKI